MIFIHFGRKNVARRLGYAADFCPICRDVRSFRIARIGNAGHLYGVALGSGDLVAHVGTCQDCGTLVKVDASLYRDILKEDPGIGPLEARTFPALRQHFAERLEAEVQVARHSPIDPRFRAGLLREPFRILSTVVEKRFGETHVDARVAAVLALTIVGTIAVALIVGRLFPSAGDAGSWAVWVAFLGGAAAVVREGLGSARRFMRRDVYPRLARALRPLNPGQEELKEILAELKRQGFKIGRKSRLDDLLAALKSVEAGPRGPPRMVRER
jgi:hypothetical protein